ncbi:MAG: prolipoprotein diacylglyceryl transferase [Anaerolineales bacterium]|nr:prolipoprotein diacylglyceryl transferase [Anaerolineales bacterium]
MRPILFSLGELQIRSSMTFLILGIITGILVGRKEILRIGFPMRMFHFFWISVIPLGILFGMINSLIFNMGFLDAIKNLGRTFSSGLVSFGAIAAILVWGYLFSRIFKSGVSTGQILDTIALVLPVIIGIYRIGCLLTGCCYGLETNGFLGVYLPNVTGKWAYRYPTQIMLMVFNLGLFFWLWMRRKNTLFDGSLVLQYLFIYSAGRLVIDSVRDLPRILGPFSLHQLTAMAMLLVSGYIFAELWLEYRVNKNSSTP